MDDERNSSSASAGSRFVADAPGAAADGDDAVNPATEALKRVGAHVKELKEYAGYYLAAKSDGFKSSMTSLAIYAALGVLAAIAGVAIIAMACVLFLRGLAGGLGSLLGNYWLGELVVGLLVLGGIGAGTWLFLKRMFNKSKQRTVAKYEERKRRQREQFGHNITDRVTEASVGK